MPPVAAVASVPRFAQRFAQRSIVEAEAAAEPERASELPLVAVFSTTAANRAAVAQLDLRSARSPGASAPTGASAWGATESR